MIDEPTKTEKAWFNKLYRLLNSMPNYIEIEVHNNHIQMNRKGARESAFESRGDGDNSEALDEFGTRYFRIYPCGESV